jgi:hypothetical protein
MDSIIAGVWLTLKTKSLEVIKDCSSDTSLCCEEKKINLKGYMMREREREKRTTE